jgi:hypothetical protein
MHGGDHIGATLAGGIALLSLIVFPGCHSIQDEYVEKVKSAFVGEPLTAEEILTESEIAHLPAPVRKYLAYTGAIGKCKPQNVRILFEAQMTKKPGDAPMAAPSEQYNFYGSPARIFFMKASTFLVPIRILHVYADQKATFVVRVASLFNAVDVAGEKLTKAETVTLLNDLCIVVPGRLIDPRLSWKEIDSLSAGVIVENGPYKISAVLSFNERGELMNVVSEDRYALQDDGTLRKAKWSTPVRDYREIDGRRIPTYGETIRHYPEGDFTYGVFRLKEIAYNVPGYLEAQP